ncbi:hypothetical protein THICB1_140002 [Thiomonas arsenitoxydans]|uniref:Transposase n=1 Tax=Thiomonas arsenitoxydans (strain DSM 22701 / CIP 110005 / 3As) TaxID=426114 RepID=A0ABP1Z0S5_THIA3|nr:hypothetical protein ACO7_100005 [Thiomonas arsenitoxydans]CQR28639.1 hypothetical protein ACO3_100005 [Thiomonas arsenitoxydans]CQR29063.1 hypothetical protein THICB6_150004 [Thiomonas arsenitoxydans]CQR30095.1 hypothetical protein THICB1_140002 [Thiomonas arsenitoxydans]
MTEHGLLPRSGRSPVQICRRRAWPGIWRGAPVCKSTDRTALMTWWHDCEDPAFGLLLLTPQAWTNSAGVLLRGLDVAQGLGVTPHYAESVFRRIRRFACCSNRVAVLVSGTWLCPPLGRPADAKCSRSVAKHHKTTPWRAA